MNQRTWKQGSVTLRAGGELLFAAALLALPGCDNSLDDIRSYTIPKEGAPAPPPVMTAAAPAAGPMQWDLPDGWEQLPNPNQMRFATLGAGAGATQIETAITQLGGPAGGVEANVERWRGQVGLTAATPEEMQRDVRPVRAAGADGVWVDLIGPAPAGAEGEAPRMFAAIFPSANATWFIKTIGTRDALDPHRDAFVALCTSVRFDGAQARASAPPVAASPPSGGPGGALPSWGALPPGWTADASPLAMSVASITVTGGAEGDASLTITPLGGVQDMLANVNRWRRQVGLGPVSDLAETQPADIEIAGAPGQLVDIGGPEQRTIGAVAVRDGMTWFYKLTGPTDLVARQREAFETFVRSIRFEEEADA